MPMDITVCYSIYVDKVDENIGLELNLSEFGGSIVFGTSVKLTEGNYTETLFLRDTRFQRMLTENVISISLMPPLWRHICLAIDNTNLTFSLVVDSKKIAVIDFQKDQFKFPNKVKDLLQGPTLTAGKVTNINVFADTSSPENIPCDGKGDVYGWRSLDWTLAQLEKSTPMFDYNKNGNYPDMPGFFIVCLKVYVLKENSVKISLNDFGTITYSAMMDYESQYIYETALFGPIKKTVNKSHMKLFPQWKNFCFQIDTDSRLLSIIIDESFVFQNLSFVGQNISKNGFLSVKEVLMTVAKISWDRLSRMKDIHIFDGSVEFNSQLHKKKGNLYMFSRFDWRKDKFLQNLITRRKIPMSEICGKNTYLENNNKLTFFSAQKVCTAVGSMAQFFKYGNIS